MGLFSRDASTHQKGLTATTAILNRLVALGYECLIPWGDHRRYDLAFITHRQGFFRMEAQIWRVQCKIARLSADGSYISFNTASVSGANKNRKATKRSYGGDADYLGVYSPDTGKVYLIFVHLAPNVEMKLRLKKTKNNQEEGIRWAKGYEI